LPFGQEVQATEDLKPTINNALFHLAGQLDLARRQVGLIFRGDAFPVVDYGYNYRAPILTYAFGWVNGNGPNKSDDNNNKDLVGRVALTLPSDYNSWLRQLSVGASIYRGKQNVFVNSGADLVDKGKKDRFGFDLAYNHHPFGDLRIHRGPRRIRHRHQGRLQRGRAQEPRPHRHLLLQHRRAVREGLPRPGPLRRLVAEVLPALLPLRPLRPQHRRPA
jgi:hypothetical protein